MSNSKEFNEANEKELEQVAGGKDTEKLHFRCPVCGSEAWVPIRLFPISIKPSCLACLKNGQDVEMTELR